MTLHNPPHVFSLPDVYRVHLEGKETAIVFHCASARPERMKICFSTHALSVILSGSKRLCDGRQTTDLAVGSAILYSRGSQYVTEDSRDYKSLIFFFSNAVLSEFLLQYQPLPLVATPSDPTNPLYTPLKTPEMLSVLAQNAAELLKTGHQISNEMSSLMCQQALLALMEHQGPTSFAFLTNASSEDDTVRVTKILETHWPDGLSIDEMAFLAGMSPSTFKRRVVGLYGMSPRKWIDLRRMGYAWHLLATEGKRPSEVANRLGYATASAFASAFRRQYGVSPSKAKSAQTEPVD